MIEHTLTFTLDARQYARLLYMFATPWLVAEPTAESMRWEDDGGPEYPRPYTHTIVAAS